MLPMTLSLAANETQRHQRVGRTVFAKSLTGEIEVTGWSSGGIIVGRARLVQGNKVTMAADFTTLEIKDTSGSTNSVDLLAGLGDFAEAGLGTIDSITQAVETRPMVDLPDDAHLVVMNSAANQYLQIGAGTNPNGIELLWAIGEMTSGAAASDSVKVYSSHNGMSWDQGPDFPDFNFFKVQGPDAYKSERIGVRIQPTQGTYPIVQAVGNANGKLAVWYRPL